MLGRSKVNWAPQLVHFGDLRLFDRRLVEAALQGVVRSYSTISIGWSTIGLLWPQY